MRLDGGLGLFSIMFVILVLCTSTTPCRLGSSTIRMPMHDVFMGVFMRSAMFCLVGTISPYTRRNCLVVMYGCAIRTASAVPPLILSCVAYVMDIPCLSPFPK